MKHLKPFNEAFENNIKQDIRDICLELEDIGFIASIDINNQYVDLFLSETTAYGRPIYPFEYNQISEVIERLKHYMIGLGFGSTLYILYPEDKEFTKSNPTQDALILRSRLYFNKIFYELNFVYSNKNA